MVADGKHTQQEILAAVKISSKTLWNWNQDPGFQQRVEERRQLWRNRVLTSGIAARANRIEAADDRWSRMKKVIEERAADPGMEGIPGGRTGLLVRDVKIGGSGPNGPEVVDVFSVDTGLLKEMRAHEEQVAKELGQWVEKRDVSIKDVSWAELAREIAAEGIDVEVKVEAAATVKVNGHANGNGHVAKEI